MLGRGRSSQEKVASKWKGRLSLDRILIHALAFTLFAIPLFICPIVTDYNLGKTAALLTLIAILAVLWGLKAWREKSWSIRLPWLTLSFGVFALAALLSLIHAANPREVIQGLVVSFFFLLLFLILVNEVRRKQDVDLMLFSLLFAGVLAGAFALVQETGILPGARGTSMFSTFGNRNYLGGYLAYLILPSVALVLGKRSLLVRLLSGFLTLFVITIVILVNQMGTLLGLIVAGAGCLLLGVLARRSKAHIPWRHLGIFAAAVALAVAVIFVRIWPSVMPCAPAETVVAASSVDTDSASSGPAESDETSLGERYEAPTTAESLIQGNSVMPRLLFWMVALRMFQDHPVTGIGLGNYKILFMPYEENVRASPLDGRLDTFYARAEAAHNDYVQIAAELGIGGILVVFAFSIVLVWSLWIRLRGTSQDRPGRATDVLLLTAGPLVLLAHAWVSFPAQLPASLLVGVALLGLMLCPVYGDRGSFQVMLGKRSLRVVVLLLALAASGGIVFAAREVAGHYLLNRGVQQLHLGNPIAATETLSRSVGLTFSPRNALYYLATAEARSGEYTTALANFERCFTCVTDDHVYLLYADLSSQLGEVEPARRAISTLLGTNPGPSMESRARYIQAQIEFLDGNNQLALDLLGTLLELDPTQERAHIGRARIFVAEDRPEDARREYESALALIDAEILELQRFLSSNSDLLLTQYGEKTSQLRFLQSEQDQVLDALGQLPESPLP